MPIAVLLLACAQFVFLVGESRAEREQIVLARELETHGDFIRTILDEIIKLAKAKSNAVGFPPLMLWTMIVLVSLKQSKRHANYKKIQNLQIVSLLLARTGSPYARVRIR